MREKAEAKRKAKTETSAAAGDGGGEFTNQAPRVSGRKMTIAKVLAKEEQRIETGSQVAGAQLSFAD